MTPPFSSSESRPDAVEPAATTFQQILRKDSLGNSRVLPPPPGEGLGSAVSPEGIRLPFPLEGGGEELSLAGAAHMTQDQVHRKGNGAARPAHSEAQTKGLVPGAIQYLSQSQIDALYSHALPGPAESGRGPEEGPSEAEGGGGGGRGRASIQSARSAPGRIDASKSMDRAEYLPYEPSAGLRNAREHLTMECAEEWRRMYASVLSELMFKVKEFLFTFFVEVLPLFLSGPFVTFVCGRDEAVNRAMRPWFFKGMSRDLFVGPGIWWATIGFYWYAADSLPFSAVYEVLSLLIFIIARAAVIGVKYAMYPDKILDRNDKAIGIDSSNYAERRVAMKQQLVCYTINADGLQRMQLVRILYQSMVHMDVDLSFSSVTFEDQEGFATRVYDEVIDMLKEVYCPRNTPKGAGGGSRGEGDGQAAAGSAFHLMHAASCDKAECPRMMGFAESFDSANVTLEGKGVLYDEDDGKMLKAFFREEGHVIAAKAARGQLPTTVLAVYLVLRCFSWQQKWGQRVIFGIFIAAFIVGFAPAAIRVGMGQQAFGDNMEQTIFNVLLCFSMYQGVAMFVWYNLGAALWFHSKLRLARQMQKLLDGDGETCGGGFVWCWEPSASHSEFHSVPRIDMRSPSDVAAWAAMRQVLNGGNFGPTIHRKVQFYGVIAMGVFVSLALVRAIGSFVAPEGEVEIGFRLYNIIRMCACIFPVVVQTLFAYTINRYTGYAEEALYRAQRSAKGRCIDYRNLGMDQRAMEMNDAHDIIGAIAAEIRASEDAGPMRVLWFVATPEVVTLIVSFVTALLALEFRDISGSLPYA